MKKLILTTALSTLMFMPAQAQFLKKLKNKVEQRVEETVSNKIAERAALQAEKSMNNLMNMQLKNSGLPVGMESVDPADIPAGYSFDWEYKLKMKTSEGEMDMVYLLKEGAPYIGIRVPQAEDMLTVLDNENQMMLMFMESGENRFIMANKITAEETDFNPDESNNKNREITKAGNKEILGYDCQGYEMDNEDHSYTFYMTEEAEVSFKDLLQTSRRELPQDLEAEWLKNGNALMMEMQMEDKKNPEQNVTMTCTGIDKKPFTIMTANYQSMGGK